jgi:DNA-binding NarL/FixJ family response regulator
MPGGAPNEWLYTINCLIPKLGPPSSLLKPIAGYTKYTLSLIFCFVSTRLRLMRIFCADNSPASQLGILHALTAHGFDVGGQFDTPSALIEQMRLHPCELLITEFRFGDEDLLDHIDALRLLAPDLKILFYSFWNNPTYLARAAAHHAYDYVLKSLPVHRLISSVACVASGIPPLDSLLAKTEQFLKQPVRATTIDPNLLTKRELQILVHLSMGLSNREISQLLEISLETVKEHVQNILRKLNSSDRTEAAVWALKHGLPTI